MRVALVCDWFLPRMGGIELHLRDLALALRGRGVEACIITTTPGPDAVDGVPVHRVKVPLLPGAGVSMSPMVVGRIADVLRAEQIDLSTVSFIDPYGMLALLEIGELCLLEDVRKSVILP